VVSAAMSEALVTEEVTARGFLIRNRKNTTIIRYMNNKKNRMIRLCYRDWRRSNGGGGEKEQIGRF
jgi:hypothetical protein